MISTQPVAPTNAPHLNAQDGQSSRNTRYGAITYPSGAPHVALTINELDEGRPYFPGADAYQALRAGTFGAVVGAMFSCLASMLVLALVDSRSSQDSLTGIATLTLLGAGCNAIRQIRLERRQSRDVSTQGTGIYDYLRTSHASWIYKPEAAAFNNWLNKVIDSTASTEFIRRPDYVEKKIKLLLRSANANPELRNRLIQIAGWTQTNCHDRAAFGLKKMLDEVRDTTTIAEARDPDAVIKRGKVAHLDAILVRTAEYIAENPGELPLFVERPFNFKDEPLELYVYFSQEIGSSLGLEDVVEHSSFASVYGKASGYSPSQVRSMVLKEADAEGAFCRFLKNGWPSWGRYLEQTKDDWFSQLDTLMLDRHEEIENNVETTTGKRPEIYKEMHLELAASERAESRRRLIENLTDHYLEVKNLDSFNFDGWIREDVDAYKQKEATFLANPDAFSHLRSTSAGALIGMH